MNAVIITIGDELLIGQVIDTNSAWIGRVLNDIGVFVIRRIAVGDDSKEIIAALNEARSFGDLILITGGLGPTKDDITKHTLSNYFNSKLVFNEEIFSMVKGFFDRLNRPMLEANRSQAEVPDVCIPIKNFNGTAPGMWFEQDGKVFVSMPGVPFEMQAMMNDYVVPKIKKQFKTPVILHKTILTQGIGESFLAEKIKDIEDAFPDGYKLAYLPDLSMVRLRITGRGTDEGLMQKTINELSDRLRSRIGENVWGSDDEKLEAVVGKLLLEQKATISTAESCTGGLVANKIISVAGASAYFKGSIVAYSDEVKTQLLGVKPQTLEVHGAVSEETVQEMTQGALERFKSTVAVAVSGIAGPDGGTEERPVGTVWIAIGNNEKIVTRKFLFPGNRERNIQMAAITALSMTRRFLMGRLEG